MANKVFFCFDHENDSWRANQVIQRWLSFDGGEAKGFLSPENLKALESLGVDTVKEWVDDELAEATVTVVLIGNKTSDSNIAKYSIKQSMRKKDGRSKGFVGIYINNLKNEEMEKDDQGANPLENFFWKNKEGKVTFISDLYKSFDWFEDKGPFNILSWVDDAEAVAEGRYV